MLNFKLKKVLNFKVIMFQEKGVEIGVKKYIKSWNWPNTNIKFSTYDISYQKTTFIHHDKKKRSNDKYRYKDKLKASRFAQRLLAGIRKRELAYFRRWAKRANTTAYRENSNGETSFRASGTFFYPWVYTGGRVLCREPVWKPTFVQPRRCW